MTFTRRSVGAALIIGAALAGAAAHRATRSRRAFAELQEVDLTPPDPGPTARFATVKTIGRVVPPGTDASFAVDVLLYYVESDPLAAVLLIDPEGKRTRWAFARSILTKAYAYMTADDAHDVTATRRDKVVEVVLFPGRDRETSITISADDVRHFLAMTASLVPLDEDAEAEAIDWAAAEEVLGLVPDSLTTDPA